MTEEASVTHHRRNQSRDSLIALTTFIVLAMMGAFLLQQPAASRLRPPVSRAVIPTGDEWYLAYAGRGIDHAVLYHDLDHAIQAAREADLLILGNSRVLYGIDQQQLRDFTQRTGIKAYCLAFAYGEKYEFPQAIIEKHDLRPKWILVNAYPFFKPGLSIAARQPLEGNIWDAQKSRFEAVASFHARRELHRIVPRLSGLDKADGVFYRSYQDGTIFRSANGTMVGRDPSRDVIPVDPTDVTTALEFQSRMAQRGSKVLLMSVPPINDQYARDLALKTQMPLILSRTTKLDTFDGSHLDHPSALRFSADLFRQLELVIDPTEQNRRHRQRIKGDSE